MGHNSQCTQHLQTVKPRAAGRGELTVSEQALAALQGRLAQELGLELEAAEHRAELQVAELQQRLRLSEEAGAAARSDIGRLKQEQNEDARMMEVGCICLLRVQSCAHRLPDEFRLAMAPLCMHSAPIYLARAASPESSLDMPIAAPQMTPKTTPLEQMHVIGASSLFISHNSEALRTPRRGVTYTRA